MALAVPTTASFTNSTPVSTGDGRAAVGYDATLMLMDAALGRIEAARRAGDTMDTRRIESAVRIIVELRAAVDLGGGETVAVNVDDLYDYMCRRLRSAGLPNGLAALDEVSHLLHALRSAWAFLTEHPQRGPADVRAASGN